MRSYFRVFIGLIGISALSGCLSNNGSDQSLVVQLTPWLTATAAATTPAETSEIQPPSPIPAPTPTPTIHIVTLGETISSIALRYGLDMNSLLAANPAIDPYALIVGDEVIIPAGDDQVQIGSLTEPLSLELSLPECFHTLEGGLWCYAILSNPLEETAANLTVTFKVISASSEAVASHTVPAILNQLEPGKNIPASVYFPAPIPASFEVTASLASALPVSQSGKTFFLVNTDNPLIEISGRLAKVSGVAVPAADPGKTVDVCVTALAYDVNGKLVGIRRTENRVTLEPEKGVVFNMYVYSFGDLIKSVMIKSEAILVE